MNNKKNKYIIKIPPTKIEKNIYTNIYMRT